MPPFFSTGFVIVRLAFEASARIVDAVDHDAADLLIDLEQNRRAPANPTVRNPARRSSRRVPRSGVVEKSRQ
jgi:hypothetical protein